MDALVEKVTNLCLNRHYIDPEQTSWFQYAISRRIIGFVTFLILLPVGTLVVDWKGVFLFLFVFRFLRARTGGYHAKSSVGCLLSALLTEMFSLFAAKSIPTAGYSFCILVVATLCIIVLAPANNANLHLTDEEITALRPRIIIRLVLSVLFGCLLLNIDFLAANCVIVSIFAVSVMLLLATLGYGTQ